MLRTDAAATLVLEIDRQGLTLPQVATCAHVLRCPMDRNSRTTLLKVVRRRPFKLPASQYQIIDSRRGRTKAIRSFSAGLALMGRTPEDYLEGKVTASRLSFAIWVASATRDPNILEEVSTGLQLGYRCSVTVNKLSDWLNGHREMWKPDRQLLEQVIEALTESEEEEAIEPRQLEFYFT